MLTFIILILLVIWSMFYTLSRFIKYYRIVRDYKDTATATIVSCSRHEPTRKKEPPALDVVIEFDTGEKLTRSEIIVPEEQADKYAAGNTLDICYHVADNGTVNVASAGDGPRKLMHGYLAAIIIEIIVYAVILIVVF